MLSFEWDSEKARLTALKHGVSFDEARGVFADPGALARYDDRYDYGEDRFVMIGLSGHRILAVAHVERDGCLRIISARPATKAEIDAYFTEQS